MRHLRVGPAIRNGFGDTVAAEQILAGGEKRTAEILDAARLRAAAARR